MNNIYPIYKLILLVLFLCCIQISSSTAENILVPGVYIIDNNPPTDTPQNKATEDYYLYRSKYFKVPPIMPNAQYAIVSNNLDDKGHCGYDCHNKVFMTSTYNPLNQYKTIRSFINAANIKFCDGKRKLDCITNYYNYISTLLISYQPHCQSYENTPSPSTPYVSTLHKAFCFGLEYKTKNTFAIASQGSKKYFTLQQPQNYQTILYTSNSIPLYTASNLSAEHQTLPRKSYLAIIKQSPNWYEVDYYSAGNEKQHGWVNRDDFIAGEWLHQEDETKQYTFEAALYNEGTDDYEGTSPYTVMIRVIDRNTNSIIQTIRNLDSNRKPDQDYSNTKANIVELIDVNFDEHLDMVTHAPEPPTTGFPQPIGVYIYQPKKQRFIESKTLSWVDELNIDKKLKTVDVVHWEGKTDRFEYKYRFINHKQILIYSSETMASLDYLETTTGHLIDGKMHYKTTRDYYNRD